MPRDSFWASCPLLKVPNAWQSARFLGSGPSASEDEPWGRQQHENDDWIGQSLQSAANIACSAFRDAGFPLLCPSESRPFHWQEISAVENGIQALHGCKHFIQCFPRQEREPSCNHAMQSTQKSSSLLRDVKSAEGAARPPLNPRTASCDSLMRRPSKRRCIASFSAAALGSVASAEPWVTVDSTVTTTACVTIAAPQKVAVQAKPTMSLSAPPSTGPAPHLFN